MRVLPKHLAPSSLRSRAYLGRSISQNSGAGLRCQLLLSGPHIPLASQIRYGGMRGATDNTVRGQLANLGLSRVV